MDLSGKRALVTGATGGIGAALARALRAEGAEVIAHGRDEERLEALAREGFPTLQADLATPGGAEIVAQRVLASGSLDILVNNAGVQILTDFRAGHVIDQIADLDRELRVNLAAPLHLTRLLLPTLLARPAAAIVQISSGLALVPKQSAPVYCATKAALHSFSTSLRWQLEGSPVRVFEALPPLVDTDMTRGRGRNKISPEQCAREIVAGLQRDQATIFVGKTALLYWLARLAPSVAGRVMRGS